MSILWDGQDGEVRRAGEETRKGLMRAAKRICIREERGEMEAAGGGGDGDGGDGSSSGGGKVVVVEVVVVVRWR